DVPDLRRLPSNVEGTSEIREVLELLRSADPQADRLRRTERARRLLANLRYAERRVRACEQRTAGDASGQLDAIQAEAEALEGELRPPAGRDSDTIEAGVDLIDRIETAVTTRCPPPAAHDEALMLIAERHRGDVH